MKAAWRLWLKGGVAWLITVGVVAQSPAGGVEAGSGGEDVSETLDRRIWPLLEKRCLECHDAEDRNGDQNFEILKQAGLARHDLRLWGKIREQIRAGTMPPKKQPPLEEAQRRELLAFIEDNERHVASLESVEVPVARTRRLNREEYNNTLRDLLGIVSRPGDKFPADGGGGEGFSNNADTLGVSPLLFEKWLAGAEEAMGEVWGSTALRSRVLGSLEGREDVVEPEVQALFTVWARRAYRREVVEADVGELMRVYRVGRARGESFLLALRVAFKAMLLSPKFLFVEETPSSPTNRNDSRGMASRLSYFLWASMPDDRLLALELENRLQDPAVLEGELKRMLGDPRGKAFTKAFAGQWLRFEEVLTYGGPDRKKFPEYSDALARSMHEEALEFCDAIFRKNGRVLDCLESDYTFVDEVLAKLYEIPGVTGTELRRVKFLDARRGGLTGMAAILATTAYPRRTSPVLRGRWVLEQLLGTPPPPPPPGVGELPKDDRDLKNVTLRERLEAHRNKPACSGCHTRLDPPGFALESFDSIGRWRQDENGKPLDTAGTLPGGGVFSNAADFRRLLLEEKALFVRCLCTRLLGYALGRSVEVSDQPTLLHLERTLREADYHAEPLLVAVVQSRLFRLRR